MNKTKKNIFYSILLLNILCFVFLEVFTFLFQIQKSSIFQEVQLSQYFHLLFEKPWTLFSYAFFHKDFLHLFVNAFSFFFIARLFLMNYSSRLFLYVYAAGIVLGGLFFIISYEIFPVFQQKKSYLLGASAAIMALLLFLCVSIPFRKITLFGNIRFPLYGLGLALVFLDLISIPLSNSGGRLSHLGGAFAGALCAFFYKVKREKEIQKSLKIAKKTTIDMDKTTEILKKVARSGYESLTSQEKKILFEGSKNEKISK